jgi:hypothetical protein
MFNRFNLTQAERAKRDACYAKLQAITSNDYAEYEPLVIDAVRGIGSKVWTYIDEGPGYRELNRTGEFFHRLRRVRNQNRALFEAINEKPGLSVGVLVGAVKSHARRNYTKGGWDYVVECWSDEEIAKAVEGCTTRQGAIRKVGEQVKTMDEVRRDIQGA